MAGCSGAQCPLLHLHLLVHNPRVTVALRELPRDDLAGSYPRGLLRGAWSARNGRELTNECLLRAGHDISLSRFVLTAGKSFHASSEAASEDRPERSYTYFDR